MPPGWKVYLVRKTAIQRIYGRRVCGVIQRNRKTILIGRNTDHYSFSTLVHELAHLVEAKRLEAECLGSSPGHGVHPYLREVFAFELPDLVACGSLHDPGCPIFESRGDAALEGVGGLNHMVID